MSRDTNLYELRGHELLRIEPVALDHPGPVFLVVRPDYRIRGGFSCLPPPCRHGCTSRAPLPGLLALSGPAPDATFTAPGETEAGSAGAQPAEG